MRKILDDEPWSVFACVFSSKSRNDSSYKYGFLKDMDEYFSELK